MAKPRQTSSPDAVKPTKPKWSLRKKFALCAAPVVVAAGIAAGVAYNEHETSSMQAAFFGGLAATSEFHLTDDVNQPDIAPPTGPYDQRLGYTAFNDIEQNLRAKNYVLVRKATGQNATWHGPDFIPPVPLFPIYDEKNQAGLTIEDAYQQVIHQAAYPRAVYSNFEAIPELVVKSLLYVENREQLEADIAPSRNYAIEWDRKFYAVTQQVFEKLGMGGDGSGGSTLAEQLEKLRHSPGGHTNGMMDKATQVFTASARAYSKAPDNTLQTRREAVNNYINAVPLSGYPGYGEVIGMLDGLAVWFNTDIQNFNTVMAKDEASLTEDEWALKAQYYRQTLALIMAVQRPTGFLRQDRSALDKRIDIYLPLFAKEGLISEALKQRALAQRLNWAPKIAPHLLPHDPEKAVNLVRVNLMQAMGLPSMHDFDRMDISAKTTIDYRATEIVNQALKDLGNPDSEKGQAVLGEKMAKPETAANIQYSFTLYERVDGANHLRIQTDNFGGEFNLNEDSMLELGSTAKLRTLVTYLEYNLAAYRNIIARAPEDYPKLDGRRGEEDGITAFVLDYIAAHAEDGSDSEQGLLDAAMNRVYSAKNYERFYTGGGVHRFHNYMPRDNSRSVTVREAFEDSVNLPFIRMMEDIVHYTIYNQMQIDPAVYDDAEHPLRAKYLDRYVLHDAIQHFNRIYNRYKGKSADEIRAQIFGKLREDLPPAHIAALDRYINPSRDLDGFTALLKDKTGAEHQDLLDDEDAFESLHRRYAGEELNLNDRAYITDIHPIELWLAQTMLKNPDADYKDLRRGVVNLAPEIYQWLEKSNNEARKNLYIFTMLEQDAFDVIHKNWAEKGFPFPRLIPSFATSIGVSGDTPAALSTLMGVILNDGKRLPNTDFTEVHLGQNTPYEHNFVYHPAPAPQVLDANIAAVVKENLQNIVENGTARRAKNAVTLSNGETWALGGKTGTGDNRIEYLDRYGNVETSKVRNRTATFVFNFGERYFGTMVAYAGEENAEGEEFTSSLPVQAFKEIMKDLTPLLEAQQTPTAPAPQTVPAQPKPAAPSV